MSPRIASDRVAMRLRWMNAREVVQYAHLVRIKRAQSLRKM